MHSQHPPNPNPPKQKEEERQCKATVSFNCCYYSSQFVLLFPITAAVLSR